MNHSQKTPCPDGRNGAAHHPVTKELPIPAAAPPKTTEYTCDVLVVGGGMAGLFAALYAKDAGSDVLLVDKGYPGYSGQSPGPAAIATLIPRWATARKNMSAA